MIFKYPLEKRLIAWREFRQQLETSSNPLDDVAKFYSYSPRTRVYSDPYDQSTWPTPWELLEENEYCPINQLLGVAYSLQLTERFQDWIPTIAIAVDSISKSVYYILYCNNKVYGYEENQWIQVELLPKSLNIKKIYSLESRH